MSRLTAPHPEYLIEPQALAGELDSPDLRIFDATVHLVPAERGYRAESGRADYEQAHIPGAAFLDQILCLPLLSISDGPIIVNAFVRL